MDSINSLFLRLKEFGDELDPNNEFPNFPITIAVLLIIKIQEFMRNTQIMDQCNAMKLSYKDHLFHLFDHPLSNKEKFEDVKRIAQFAFNVYRAIPEIPCTLSYRIAVADGISVAVYEFLKINKRGGSNNRGRKFYGIYHIFQIGIF